MHGQKGMVVVALGYGGVFLNGGASSVLPCIESVGGCEGADGFDDGGEWCFGSIGLPWAGASMGSCVVGE